MIKDNIMLEQGNLETGPAKIKNDIMFSRELKPVPAIIKDNIMPAQGKLKTGPDVWTGNLPAIQQEPESQVGSIKKTS